MKKLLFISALITFSMDASAQLRETATERLMAKRMVVGDKDAKSNLNILPPDKEKKKLVDKNLPAGIHVALYSGAWIPHGNLSAVGNHPYIGFQLGSGGGKWYLSVSSAIRFGSIPDSITVKKGDDVYKSRSYLAACWGIDATYALFKRGIHQLDVEGGIGLDMQRILSVKRQDLNTRVKRTLASPDINVRVGYNAGLMRKITLAWI